MKNICENYPKYQNLYASWCLNKKACEDILGTVVNHYPHYSVHDARHSETIVTCMELLLGDERITLLYLMEICHKTRKVIREITSKYENVRKEVTSVMGSMYKAPDPGNRK